MALTVAERVMPIRAPREIAILLRSKERCKGAAAIVLGSVASTIAACDPRLYAPFEAARSVPAVEGPERPQGLTLLSLLVVALAESLVHRQLVAALKVTPTALSTDGADWP
jgi:hypothetical protein